MPRPILKSLSSYSSSPTRSPTRSQPSDNAVKREMQIAGFKLHRGAHRRVTFSPFTRRPPLEKSGQLIAVEQAQGSLSSGFTFSSATEAEKRKQSRRKQELQTMQTLYSAARRRPHSLKSVLLANVPALKKFHTWATDWLDFAKTIRNSVPWPQRARRKPRPRMLLRGPWTDLDTADHEYVKQLSMGPTTPHSTLLLPAPASAQASRHSQLAIVQSTPQPDLTPARRGSFSSLLRREGIPVDEDVRRENRFIDDDLRGISHPSRRLHVSQRWAP